MNTKQNGTATAKYLPNFTKDREYLLLNPTDCIDEAKPCHKWKPSNTNAPQ
jgi:hypothetical protein